MNKQSKYDRIKYQRGSDNTKPLIKWPGGKSCEIHKFEKMIPSYERYVEPFFGGGALFFHLNPKNAIINDISDSLMSFYRLIKCQDRQLFELLDCYNSSFSNLVSVCNDNYDDIVSLYSSLADERIKKSELLLCLNKLTESLADKINSGFSEKLLMDDVSFSQHINNMVADKMVRTVKNSKNRPFSNEDLKQNLVTGFTSGYYMYFRKVFNDLNLGRIEAPSEAYKVANFYFIREYCYGSMFRYNSKGEFNIPYGGMSYNKKNFMSKVENMFGKDIETVLKNTEIHCSDFEEFFKIAKLSDRDFMFLDPPYDTSFSNYEGTDFTKKDQERLADCLKKTSANFILVIKHTDYISNLYKDNFNILSFDNQYTYNVRSRNERNVEHLIITNLPV